MEQVRRELQIEGQYLRIRSTGEIFKAIQMVVHDKEKGHYYVADNGQELSSKECFAIQLPSKKEFDDIIAKYPNALERKSNRISEMQISITDELAKKYGEATNLTLLNELRHYKKECKRIEKLLGIE